MLIDNDCRETNSASSWRSKVTRAPAPGPNKQLPYLQIIMSAFTDSQINTFQAFTGVASRQECEMYLEMSGGNVEGAVGIFFGGELVHRLATFQVTAIPGTMKQSCLIGLLSLGVKIFNQIVSLKLGPVKSWSLLVERNLQRLERLV